MLSMKLKYKCPLCGHKKFYVAPIGTKTETGDIYYTLHQFKLVCKNCNKTFVLTYKIEAI